MSSSLQIVEHLVIEVKLSLERTIGDPSRTLEERAGVLDDFRKPHTCS